MLAGCHLVVKCGTAQLWKLDYASKNGMLEDQIYYEVVALADL